MECEHVFIWNETKLGGFAQCDTCKWVFTEVGRESCVGYVDPEVLEVERKKKRAEERERKRKATIEWLASKK